MEAPTSGSNPEGETPLESDSQRRPLTNEYILAEVLSYLSVEDLKECRLVNLLWNQVATRVTIPKTGATKLESRYLKRFMEIMDSCLNWPCKKISLNSHYLQNPTPQEEIMLPELLEKMAPLLIHLEINTPSTEKIFPAGKPQRDTEYSCLKSLGVILPTCSEQENMKLDFVIDVLQHSPNLHRISMEIEYDSGPSCKQAFCRLLEYVSWNQIQRLDLRGELEDHHLGKILELGPGMQLTSFEFRAWESVTLPLIYFPKFLERHSQTLKNILLYFYWLPSDHNIQLPCFPQLQTLRVEWVFEDESCFLVLPSFSAKFPVLTSLTISRVEWGDLDLFVRSEDKIPVETVRKLRLDLDNEDDSSDPSEVDARRIVRHMAQMFPRVTVFEVPAHREILKAIEKEKAWKDLKELTLLCGQEENVDEALTGLSEEEREQVLKMQPGSWEFQLKERIVRIKILKFFHGLQTLRLDANRFVNWNNSFFSDISCGWVLLKLKNLKSLDIRRILPKAHEVSGGMIREMRSKFQVLNKKC